MSDTDPTEAPQEPDQPAEPTPQPQPDSAPGEATAPDPGQPAEAEE